MLVKVRQAQWVGASAVVVADTMCLCSDSDCVPTAADKPCEVFPPALADDGSGGDISIRAILLAKQDADNLKRALKSNQDVTMNLEWLPPAPDHSVHYDLFTLPSDETSYFFLSSFKIAVSALGDRAQFKPHMHIYDGITAQCRGKNRCDDMCTNHGRYCANPDPVFHAGITGSQIVTESLRRLCIWEHYGHGPRMGLEWWVYAERFIDRCNEEANFSNMDCIEDVYLAASIEGSIVEECIFNSTGGVTRDEPNVLLDLAIEEQRRSGAIRTPSLFIDGFLLHDSVTFTAVFRAICAQYSTIDIPAICRSCMNDFYPERCIGQKAETI